MVATRSEHSRMGIASFVLAFLPGVLLIGTPWLVRFFVSMQPAGADTVAYGFGMFFLLVLTMLSELVALGLGVAGAFQRSRKRTFALLGMACSVLVFGLIHAAVGFVDVANFIVGLTEGQPKVRSPGSE